MIALAKHPPTPRAARQSARQARLKSSRASTNDESDAPRQENRPAVRKGRGRLEKPFLFLPAQERLQ